MKSTPALPPLVTLAEDLGSPTAPGAPSLAFVPRASTPRPSPPRRRDAEGKD
jgi:hypothetical protein